MEQNQKVRFTVNGFTCECSAELTEAEAERVAGLIAGKEAEHVRVTGAEE